MRHLRPLTSSLTLLLVAVATTVACSSAPSDGSESSAEALSQSQCAAAKAWAPNTAYKVGDVVIFEGVHFVVIQAHTSESVWPPNIVPALYQVASCSSSGGSTPAPAPTTAPAPTAAPTSTTPPAPPPAPTSGTSTSGNGGNGTTCVGGPKFDPAGAKNVGNGHGEQFIGGQCLSTADCASGCCAFPCGICSGPGAQFQAGKEGCGF
jgi:hypothetical protein